MSLSLCAGWREVEPWSNPLRWRNSYHDKATTAPWPSEEESDRCRRQRVRYRQHRHWNQNSPHVFPRDVWKCSFFFLTWFPPAVFVFFRFVLQDSDQAHRATWAHIVRDQLGDTSKHNSQKHLHTHRSFPHTCQREWVFLCSPGLKRLEIISSTHRADIGGIKYHNLLTKYLCYMGFTCLLLFT